MATLLPFYQLMKIHQTIWRLCGAWFTNYSFPRLYTTYSIVLHILHLNFCISQWMYLQNVYTMIEAIDILTVGSIFTLVSIKSVLFIWQKPKCVQILNLLNDIERTIDSESEVEQMIVKKTTRQMRIIGMLIAVCAFNAALIHFIMTQVLSGQRLLVFPAIMPFDWQHNDYWFYGSIVYQSLFAIYSSVILATLDIIGPHIYMLLEAYLRILDHRLKSIGWERPGGPSADDEGIFQAHGDRQIVECVKLHKQCLK